MTVIHCSKSDMTVVSLKISCAVLTLLEMVRDEKHGCGETSEELEGGAGQRHGGVARAAARRT